MKKEFRLYDDEVVLAESETDASNEENNSGASDALDSEDKPRIKPDIKR